MVLLFLFSTAALLYSLFYIKGKMNCLM